MTLSGQNRSEAVRRRRYLSGARGRLAFLMVVGLAMTFAIGVARSTTTTRFGLNYKVSTRQEPVYLKALGFVHRHYEYKLLAKEITQGITSDAKRTLAIFNWTRRNIPHTPAGWPVVDDHILNIIIRGHGVSDQMADVFCTLSTYAGTPAFWHFVREPGARKTLILSLTLIDGRWVPFDVANGFVFRSDRGDLIDVKQLANKPKLVAAVVNDFEVDGVPYVTFLRIAADLPARVPRPLRSELQSPWMRAPHELAIILRLKQRDESQ